MSAAVEIYRDDLDASYAVDFSRDREPTQKRSRFPEYRRQGNAPSRVNGMHCRRQKRWTWGSGRGARMLNARAFAGSLAFAVASLAATAFGITIQELNLKTVGNTGNANSTAGLGAVSSTFKISAYEVSNTQYAQFLNSVGATNPNSIYNANMGTNAAGGITQSGVSGSFTYAVKAGMGNNPVNFVTWWSAARFMNWLQGGQTNNVSSLETGSYTLNNATSGAIVARNAAAAYFLPSSNQAYKAAYYNPANSSYFTYGTSNNSAPNGGTGTTAAITSFTGTNSANFNSSGSTAVGSFASTVSPYGLFDATGNINEMTDTVNPTLATQVYSTGGAFNAAVAPSGAAASFSNLTGTAGIGFRVAAVPEPSTLGLAGVGFVALVGLQVMKHRRRKMAA
jgi:hypothetical protein